MGYYTGGDYYMAGGGWDFVAPALNFLSGAFGKSNSGTPTNVLGTAAGKLGLPFTSQQQLGAATVNPALAGGFSVEGGRKRRRMNPLNPRALRRALSRARSFEKFARRTVSITTRMKFKKRRRR